MTRETQPDAVGVPGWFLAETAPRIREMAEMQVMLAFFRLSAGSDAEEPLSEDQLIQDEALAEGLRMDGASLQPVQQIRRGIELAVARDTLLRFEVASDTGTQSYWLLLATQENRIKLERYRSGVLPLPGGAESQGRGERVAPTRPGVFKLYEQNIGLVTPIIADRLVEALELYPEAWIEDAIEAAVSYNRRNWRYIQRILETWATEGRGHEANRRRQSNTGDFDPERHFTGEYAPVFRRRKRE